MTINLRFAACLAGVALFFTSAFSRAAEAKTDLKPYPLSKCIVSGDKLGGDMGKPFVLAYQDREIKLCCKGCQKDFEKDAAEFIKKIDAAEKEAAAKNPYRLTTCLVSGEKLDSMGKPFVFVYEDKEIKLCCKSCLKDFRKTPEKFMKQLAKADKAAAK
jgi:hypothetical protein